MAGGVQRVSVQILDQSGNPFKTYNGKVSIRSSDPQASLPADYIFTDADQGRHDFDGISLKTAGQQTLSIRDSAALASEVVQNISVIPSVPSDMSFVLQPAATATAGANFGVQPQFRVRDAYGNLTSSVSAQFTVGAFTNASCTSAAAGSLTAAISKDAPQVGMNSFSNVSYTRAETIYIGVSAPGLTSICSGMTVVSAGAANRIVLSTQPSANVVAGANFAQNPVASIQDNLGNIVASAAVPLTINAYSDANCSVAGLGVFNAAARTVNSVNGVASFSGVNYSRSGTLYLGVSSGGLVSVCSSVVNVSPAAASSIAFSVQPSATAVAGINFGSQPQASLTDAFGNAATLSTNAITLTAYTNNTCTAAATGNLVAAARTVNAAAGVASFSGVNYTRAEMVYLGASGTGLTSACSSAISVAPGAASVLALTVQPSNTAQAGSALATQPRLNVMDAFGNVASMASNSVTVRAYTNSACTTAATGTLSATSLSVTPVAGVVSFAGISYTRAESIFLGFSATGLSSACSSAVAVSAGAANRLAMAIQPSSAAQVNTALAVSPSVNVLDSFGNLVTTGSSSIQLSAFRDAACSVPATGVLTVTTNPVNSASGVAAFSGVRYSVAENIFLGASSTGLTRVCSSQVAVTAAPPVNNGTANLAWDANTETDLAGYKVYISTSPGVYNNPPITLLNVTTYTATTLASGTTYYFTVTAYNTSGMESTRSNEVSKVIP